MGKVTLRDLENRILQLESLGPVVVASSTFMEVFNTTITDIRVASGILYFRAPINMTLGEFRVQLFEKNGVSSGTLEIDIKKAVSPDNALMTSIFSVKPNTNFATNSNYASFGWTMSSNTISAGEYYRLDVTQVPSGFTGSIHVMLYTQ